MRNIIKIVIIFLLTLNLYANQTLVKTPNSSIFNKKELSYLAQKGTIKLCVDPDWMPFEGVKDGKYVGMIADYFDLVRQKTDIKIEVYHTKSWDESLRAIKNRKCDIIGSASPTPTRLNYMNFTTAYMKSPMVLVTDMDKSFISDIDDILDKKLGITKGYAIAEILKIKYPKINIIYVDNIQAGFKKVESGELYGYIDNLSVTVANIRQAFHGTLKVSARLDESDDLTIGSRNDEPVLNAIFQKVVDNIDKVKVRHILNEWVLVKESISVDYTFLWNIAAVIIIIFLIIVFYTNRLRKSNIKLALISREDALTKVGNRLKLNEFLEEEYRYTCRYRVTCGVILLDIDDFKKVNDTHGHLVGDEVLKKFASILTANLRDTDKVGRWGGEEFLLVCPNTDLKNLIKIAEGLRKNIENYDFGENIDTITTSLGVSIFDGSKTIEEVLDEADRGLYSAKNSGKNRIVSLVV
jgi:diguanylate cyclase (GGDEF)-like protein